MMTTEEMIMYDQFVELNIATAEEINLVWNCGEWRNWEECLNRILYCRTGFRTLEQMFEEENEED